MTWTRSSVQADEGKGTHTAHFLCSDVLGMWSGNVGFRSRAEEAGLSNVVECKELGGFCSEFVSEVFCKQLLRCGFDSRRLHHFILA